MSIKAALTYSIRPLQAIHKGLSYVVVTPEQQEQERTTIKKKIFLEVLEKTKGIITLTCQEADVGRATYYVWLENDPAFKASVEAITRTKSEILEDKMQMLAYSGDFRALKYLLDYYKKSDYKEKNQFHFYYHPDAKKTVPIVSLHDLIANPELLDAYQRLQQGKISKEEFETEKDKFLPGEGTSNKS